MSLPQTDQLPGASGDMQEQAQGELRRGVRRRVPRNVVVNTGAVLLVLLVSMMLGLLLRSISPVGSELSLATAFLGGLAVMFLLFIVVAMVVAAVRNWRDAWPLFAFVGAIIALDWVSPDLIRIVPVVVLGVFVGAVSMVVGRGLRELGFGGVLIIAMFAAPLYVWAYRQVMQETHGDVTVSTLIALLLAALGGPMAAAVAPEVLNLLRRAVRGRGQKS